MEIFQKYKKSAGVPWILVTYPKIIKIDRVTLELSLRTHIFGTILGVFTPLWGAKMKIFQKFEKGLEIPPIHITCPNLVRIGLVTLEKTLRTR